ncbi:MAG: HAMP domain-containing sensor histidine kinase [Aggregatilineales bacterium]
MTENKLTSRTRKTEKRPRGGMFVSLRWRMTLPVFIVALIIAMIGAYLIAGNLTQGLDISQQNVLLQSSQATQERAASLYRRQAYEAQQVAFTIGAAEAVLGNNATALEDMLTVRATAGQQDAVIVTNRAGMEVLGVQAVNVQGESRYALSTGTDLSTEPLIRSTLDDGYNGATGLMITPNGVMLFTSTRIIFGDEIVGVALVGQLLSRVLEDLQASAYTDLALYGSDGTLLATTFDSQVSRSDLQISNELFIQSLRSVREVPIADVQVGEGVYRAAYQPFIYGDLTVNAPLGVIAAVMNDNVPFITEVGRQLVALFAAALTGGVVFFAYMYISRVSKRAENVRTAAVAMAAGENVRTGMRAREEIGAIGQALDEYADAVDVEREYAQRRQDKLEKVLRRQRREYTYVIAVLESMPNGVIVQAMDGRVMLMNDEARRLLGSQRVYRSSGLHELADVVAENLGAALAPGLYALGDPRRIGIDERMLTAQAAAILSVTDTRLGTVILLNDITAQVQQEREREALLHRIASDIQQPLMNLARVGARSQSNMVNAFARELARHTVTLQKTIVEMQDIAQIDSISLKRTQRAVHLETLVWALANEWRQVALVNDLKLHVMIDQRDLYVLGDERRLRWAIGNLLDNAIKYTTAGGALTLEIKAEGNGMANLRVRDNGVGISKQELPYVFTRFFRGTPTTRTGEILRVPGMGQGLHTAQQIFNAHGGKLAIRSTQSIGTAAYFSLPLTAPDSMYITPYFDADMDGDTMKLSEAEFVELERKFEKLEK